MTRTWVAWVAGCSKCCLHISDRQSHWASVCQREPLCIGLRYHNDWGSPACSDHEVVRFHSYPHYGVWLRHLWVAVVIRWICRLWDHLVDSDLELWTRFLWWDPQPKIDCCSACRSPGSPCDYGPIFWNPSTV